MKFCDMEWMILASVPRGETPMTLRDGNPLIDEIRLPRETRLRPRSQRGRLTLVVSFERHSV